MTGENLDGALNPHLNGLDIWPVLRLTHRVLEALEEGHMYIHILKCKINTCTVKIKESEQELSGREGKTVLQKT